MNFLEAIEHVKKGGWVRLPEWRDGRHLCLDNRGDGFVLQCDELGAVIRSGDEYRPLAIREYICTDWEVVED